jgi:DNA-binding transcriptional LysR family regulator
MNLKQLTTFVRIVEKGSFAAAAEALHTTQSTVSARVKDLEHYLGVALFDRSAHRAQLTAKGRELFDMSRHVVGALEQLRDRIGDKQALTGTLRLGVVGVVAGTWLPALVKELRARHPALELDLEVALSRALLQKLRDALLDIAIIAGRVDDDDMRAEPVGEEPFAWMASPSLGAPPAPVSPSDIARFPIIAFPSESYHHAVVKAWFKEGGVRFQPSITCNSMAVIARLVAEGIGVGLLPSDYYGKELTVGRLQILEAQPPMPGAEFTLVSLAERQTAFVSAVSDAVRSVTRQRLDRSDALRQESVVRRSAAARGPAPAPTGRRRSRR